MHMSPRLNRGSGRRFRFLPVLAIAALAAVFMITNASAVHDLGLFQLDRNATDGGLGDDWNTPPAPTGGAEVFTGILEDNATAEQFTGGGSKDDLDIGQWLWKSGEPLDKDNITNAYAAGYVSTKDTGETNVGDFIVYYGLDRFANNGSAQVGFWFFRSQIGLSNVKSGGGLKFSGAHTVGDILVQSNFSQGGVISSVSVFKWVGSGGSHGSLDVLFEGADCVGADPDAAACATVNQATVDAPWPYAAKAPDAANPTGFPQGSFFEGGINLTRLVPDVGCLSTFMAETRSSTPFDSRLFDFALGDFNTCRAAVSTTSSTTVNGVPATEVVPGTSVSDTATVTGSSLTGGTAPTPTGTVDFHLCQPAPNGTTAAGCPAGSGTKIGTTKTLDSNGVATSDATTNPSTTSAIGKYCWRAEYTPAAGSAYTATSHTNATTECFTTVAQPTITTTRQFVFPQDKAKIAATSGGNLAGNVTFKLFDSLAECTADTDVKFSETLAVSGSAPQTKTTSNTTYRITDGTTHYWKVTYDSTNAAQLDSVSACDIEKTQVTYAGNDTSIAIP